VLLFANFRYFFRCLPEKFSANALGYDQATVLGIKVLAKFLSVIQSDSDKIGKTKV